MNPLAYSPPNELSITISSGEAIIIRALTRISEQLAYLTETLKSIERNR